MLFIRFLSVEKSLKLAYNAKKADKLTGRTMSYPNFKNTLNDIRQKKQINNACSITKNKLKSLGNTEFSH